MMKLHSVEVKTLTPEIFRMFQVNTALLTAGDEKHLNTMTIGWGQLGTLWNLPVCTVYVRPERYTYEFMEAQDTFSVSVLPDSARDIARLCGTRSGREVDKVSACNLTVCRGAGNTPFFEEAELVLVCRKLFVQDMDPACVRDERIFATYGEKGGWHRIYTGEVLEAYCKS